MWSGAPARTSTRDALKAHLLGAARALQGAARVSCSSTMLPRTALGKVQHFMLRRLAEPRDVASENASLKIAVLGGGNGSFAAAGDFALAGPRRPAVAARCARRSRRIARRAARSSSRTSTAGTTRKLALVTTDIAEAVRDAELILCPAPAPSRSPTSRGARAASDRRPGRVPAARHLRLDDLRQGRTRRRQPRATRRSPRPAPCRG